MAHTIQITTADKLSVVLFLCSIVYCIFLALVPSVENSHIAIFIAIAGNIAWISLFMKITEDIENQSVYSFLNIPSAIIWIALLAQVL